MNIETYIKDAFCVIGKEGSAEEGPGFVQRLWDEANSNFPEVAPLARKEADGSLCGIWGAMTDFSRSFRPWEENFSRGLYLAGIECREDAVPPAGWTKWTVPGFEYLKAECDREDLFPEMLRYLQANHMTLAGAVQDFTCPQTGKSYMLFPIRKL